MVTLAVGLVAGHHRAGRGAGAIPQLAGVWTGTLTLGHRRAGGGTVSCTLTADRTGVRGTIDLAAGATSGSTGVRGRVRGKRAWLRSGKGGMQLAWHGRWSDAAGAWRGPVAMRHGGARDRGTLVLRHDATAGACGAADLFASQTMPVVFQPICAQCHVANGTAAATRLRVTPGDAAATMASAAALVDTANPEQSLVLRKPRLQTSHGGGLRLPAGSAQEQAMVAWVTLLASPECRGGGNGGGGGGGNGGGGSTGNLYLDQCASCHGADARGLQGRPDIHCNRNVAPIVRSGRIGGPNGDMPAFPDLTDADVATIQAYLVGLCPDTSVTGADLYTSNCATCHGSSGDGTATAPPVRCATRVADAVRTGRGTAMPSFAVASLSDGNVAAIATHLDGLCTSAGRPGAALYAGNCGTCHAADAGGGSNALGVAGPPIACNRGIAPAVAQGQGPDMPPFPGLAAGDVAAIQAYLGGLCPIGTATGAQLYAGNCAGCHGATATGGPSGQPAIRCSKAIAPVVQNGQGTMAPLANLGVAEIASIQTYLNGLCPPGGAAGADLWAGNCAACHAAAATGTATAPNVRCATRVPDAVTVGRGARMPSFPIAGADLAALATGLQQLCTQAGRPGADLWTGNCGTCHGADGRGGENGLGVVGPNVACNRSIASVVASGSGQMPAFPALGGSDVTAVQQHMLALCPSATASGEDLYAGNCATCHGADAKGGPSGQPPVRCSKAIADAVQKGRTGMPAFPTMTSAEIGRVQSYLDGLCPPGTANGGELLASNCLSCHGPTAGGTADAPSVRCATLVADALAVGRGPRMPAFPDVVGVDLTAVESALAQLCVAAGRTASDLYAGNCSTCHGATAGGGRNGLGVHGPDINCASSGDYLEAVRQGEDRMPPFPALSNADVGAIHDFVHASWCF